ncbi:MAG: hypothetical protein ACFCA4_18785 [Cyanophyceae cyanobacterium]
MRILTESVTGTWFNIDGWNIVSEIADVGYPSNPELFASVIAKKGTSEHLLFEERCIGNDRAKNLEWMKQVAREIAIASTESNLISQEDIQAFAARIPTPSVQGAA